MAKYVHGLTHISEVLADIYRPALEEELKRGFVLASMGDVFGPPRPPKPANTRRYSRSTRYRMANKLRYGDDYYS